MRKKRSIFVAMILFLFLSGLESVNKEATLDAKRNPEFSAYGLKVVNLGDRVVVEYQGQKVAEIFQGKLNAASVVPVFPGVRAKLTCLEKGCFRLEASFRSLPIIWAKLLRAWQGKNLSV